MDLPEWEIPPEILHILICQAPPAGSRDNSANPALPFDAERKDSSRDSAPYAQENQPLPPRPPSLPQQVRCNAATVLLSQPTRLKASQALFVSSAISSMPREAR